LFSNWPTIEVGIGLIAVNLPSISFRTTKIVPRVLRRGFDFSWLKVQEAVAALPIPLDSRVPVGEDSRIQDVELSNLGDRRV
jgi:hypothetical protein